VTASYLMFKFESLHLSEEGNMPGRVLCHYKRCTLENKNSFWMTLISIPILVLDLLSHNIDIYNCIVLDM
jgi:hypothetical protein